MDIEYKGGNCVVITYKKDTFVVDPGIATLGLKNQGAKATAHLLTQPTFAAPHDEETVVIDGPGEYEVDNVSIKGIAALAHMDPKGDPMRATMYRLDVSEVSIAIIGHVHPDLNENQLEQLGVIDVVIVPIGGNGYTLDATGAIQVIKAIGPKVVIPTHYSDKGVTYEVPQADLETFTKELGATPEVTNKLKIKPGTFTDGLSVQQITRTA